MREGDNGASLPGRAGEGLRRNCRGHRLGRAVTASRRHRFRRGHEGRARGRRLRRIRHGAGGLHRPGPRRAGPRRRRGAGALNAVDAIAPRPGETVLVSGATGGVGAFAIQLAAAAGAYVIGSAQPGAERAYLRDLGADDTVDYTGDVPAAVAALRPDGIHAVVHLAGDGLELADLLVAGGRIASTLGLTADDVGGRAVQVIPVMAAPVRQTLERLAFDVVAGQLTVPVQRTYALADVPRALADFAAGTRGKLAISVA